MEQLALVCEGEREEPGLRTPCSFLFSPRPQARPRGVPGRWGGGGLSFQRWEHGACVSLRVLAGDFLCSVSVGGCGFSHGVRTLRNSSSSHVSFFTSFHFSLLPTSFPGMSLVLSCWHRSLFLH